MSQIISVHRRSQRPPPLPAGRRWWPALLVMIAALGVLEASTLLHVR